LALIKMPRFKFPKKMPRFKNLMTRAREERRRDS
jgi:hypothetical protein